MAKVEERACVDVTERERVWLDIKDVCSDFGLSYSTAKNRIYFGTFPVPTYKVGKKIVVDRAVLDAYWQRKRDEQLAIFSAKSQLK